MSPSLCKALVHSSCNAPTILSGLAYKFYKVELKHGEFWAPCYTENQLEDS